MEEKDLRALVEKALQGKYGQATIDLTVILLPGLRKMGLQEVTALVELLNQRDLDGALKASYAKMSNEELSKAKTALAGLLKLAADDNAEVRDWVNDFLLASLKIALSIALVGVGL